ncbi:hypothetical protein DEIPH_ctg033orf0183 [Deinococcus phoenicis]|uniref:DUF4259 domain-containing protein n=1 Tax=Deinococcus phoenicis TaxID=1476583 RepID=A0A016QNU5_9DEIO|nr:DUF4259 domain-containing protein [Deinococcus phoenicis]EYB67748.1 hypothetical protein DEIPH_ctg033orf0183 [Deinococcus phoenicis]
MNIWGTGSFENEIGAAFAQEVVQDGTFALAEAFDVALDPDNDFLAAEEGHRVLAAAEILAAALTGETAGITDAALRGWVGSANLTVLEPLRELAREAVRRVCGPESELPDLWADRGDEAEWQAEVERLQAALG